MTSGTDLRFGEELRRERLVRGITLEEVSAATKISIRVLQALERGELDVDEALRRLADLRGSSR